eukprot:scaffold47529_cov36-Cyclotella_meneghiniana.AAC.1
MMLCGLDWNALPARVSTGPQKYPHHPCVVASAPYHCHEKCILWGWLTCSLACGMASVFCFGLGLPFLHFFHR